MKFLNSHVENRYESHVIPNNFGKTPNGPIKATSYITVADTINILRMLYGECREDDPETLHLPPNWGTQHPTIIDQWFHTEKLQDHHRAELGINQEFYDPEAGFGDNDISNEVPEANHN